MALLSGCALELAPGIESRLRIGRQQFDCLFGLHPSVRIAPENCPLAVGYSAVRWNLAFGLFRAPGSIWLAVRRPRFHRQVVPVSRCCASPIHADVPLAAIWSLRSVRPLADSGWSVPRASADAPQFSLVARPACRCGLDASLHPVGSIAAVGCGPCATPQGHVGSIGCRGLVNHDGTCYSRCGSPDISRCAKG